MFSILSERLTLPQNVYTIVNINKGNDEKTEGEIVASEVISIRLRPEEVSLIERLASFYGTSPAKAIKQAAIEKAENEIDYEIAAVALKEHMQHPSTYSVDDFRREFLSK